MTKRETLNIRGTLVTKSECSRNPSEVKKTLLLNAKINFLKYKLLFTEFKVSTHIDDNITVLLVIYTENKLRANYAKRWGGGIQSAIKSDQKYNIQIYSHRKCGCVILLSRSRGRNTTCSTKCHS